MPRYRVTTLDRATGRTVRHNVITSATIPGAAITAAHRRYRLPRAGIYCTADTQVTADGAHAAGIVTATYHGYSEPAHTAAVTVDRLPALLRCQNCGHTAPHDTFRHARDITQRHSIGDTYSDRECPQCGALAYPTEV